MAVARNPAARANPVELEDYLCKRAGLLAARGECVYAFPHRTFQEYLAACHLTDHGFPDDLATLLRTDPQRWREATLLAGAKAARGTSLGVWALAEALCYEEAPQSGKCPEAAAWGALLAAQVLLENEGGRTVSPRNAPKLERVRLWQRAIVERGWLPPVDRLQAGNALAVLGDDRDFDALVEVPAGPFLMGDDRDSDAKPRHEITLDAFRIGKYPVTVGQWKRFVAANPDYRYDRDSLQGLDNHPAHDVSWHDARACCAWLTQEWRQAGKIAANEEVRLPTEAEWEKAASWEPRGRGRKRAYPWGDDFDTDKCNTSESGLGTTSPVGMYPEGASAYGCLDMTGNVWEWTRSLWGKDWDKPEFKYPYRPDDGRENLKADDNTLRVLRGGAFRSLQLFARCACRHGWFGPIGRDRDYSFRVVVAPPRAAPT